MEWDQLYRFDSVNLNAEIRYLRAKTRRKSKVKKKIQSALTPVIETIVKRGINLERRPDQCIFHYINEKGTLN